MKIFNINLDRLKYKDFFRKITKFEKQNIVFTPNPEILLKTKSDKEFWDLLKESDFLTPDGIGLYIAFQILAEKNTLFKYIKLPYYFFNLFFRRQYLYKQFWDRICGSDLTKDVLQFAQKNKIKITIIDLYNPTDTKKVESQEIFSDTLKSKFPELTFDYFIYNPEHKDSILKKIQKSESKVLFSTLGMKKQEESVIEIIGKCKNIKLWLGIWSSFDYIIWFQKRAPTLFRKLWLEWLYRLITGPRKIDRLKRIWNAIFIFTYTILREK